MYWKGLVDALEHPWCSELLDGKGTQRLLMQWQRIEAYLDHNNVKLHLEPQDS